MDAQYREQYKIYLKIRSWPKKKKKLAISRKLRSKSLEIVLDTTSCIFSQRLYVPFQ